MGVPPVLLLCNRMNESAKPVVNEKGGKRRGPRRKTIRYYFLIVKENEVRDERLLWSYSVHVYVNITFSHPERKLNYGFFLL